MSFGIDYAWGRPSVSSLRANGVTFCARYLSGGNSKDITASERASLNAAGITTAVVWETTAARILGGYAAGVADARAADHQASSVGMPGVPIYFACDTDTTSYSTVNSYLQGAGSVIGKARVGLYAGIRPVSHAFDAGVITYGWQTYAWSGGALDPRAQLYQYSNGHVIDGVGVDYDRSTHADFGQWPRPGGNPGPVTPPAPAEPTVKLGSANTAANVQLRILLNAYGAGLPHDADGSGSAFGKSVDAAVKAFQKANGLTADGVVGPLTWAKLLDRAHAKRIPVPPVYGPVPPPVPPVVTPGTTTGLAVAPVITLRVTWRMPSPVPPHWRVQVAADAVGKVGELVPGGSFNVTTNRADVPVPHAGVYWVRVQASGNAPFTPWMRVAA